MPRRKLDRVLDSTVENAMQQGYGFVLAPWGLFRCTVAYMFKRDDAPNANINLDEGQSA
jgi:hypothetical protein